MTRDLVTTILEIVGGICVAFGVGLVWGLGPGLIVVGAGAVLFGYLAG